MLSIVAYNLTQFCQIIAVSSCETKLRFLSLFCFLNVSQFWGATLNLGVTLPKISNKALWKLGVAPKLELNDGQKQVESIFSPSFKICSPEHPKLR